jgi:hypothetical protein
MLIINRTTAGVSQNLFGVLLANVFIVKYLWSAGEKFAKIPPTYFDHPLENERSLGVEANNSFHPLVIDKLYLSMRKRYRYKSNLIAKKHLSLTG